jgi:hypothetical protein
VAATCAGIEVVSLWDWQELVIRAWQGDIEKVYEHFCTVLFANQALN